jgi:hypothetical protein
MKSQTHLNRRSRIELTASANNDGSKAGASYHLINRANKLRELRIIHGVFSERLVSGHCPSSGVNGQIRP